MNVQNSNEEMNFIPVAGGEELTVGGTAVAAAALPAGATHAMICIKTKAVHMGFYVTPASGAAGIYLASGSRLFLRKYTLELAKFIEADSGQAAVVTIIPGTF